MVLFYLILLIEKEDVVKVIVTGIQKYGVFAQTDNYEGLIHISEISYGYVKNVNDYVKIGDEIYAKVVDVDNEDNHLKLSIKDIDYKNDGSKLERMKKLLIKCKKCKKCCQIS